MKQPFCHSSYFLSKTYYLIIIFIALFSNNVFSQDYTRVDATIQLYPERFDEVSRFNSFLSRDFNTDE